MLNGSSLFLYDLTNLLLFILAPEQWTMIPVPVKLFKLIINELGTLLESAAAGDENKDRDSDEVSIQVLFVEYQKRTLLNSNSIWKVSPISALR